MDPVFMRERLLIPAIEADRGVVVIMHSYSGGPGSVAAKVLGVAECRAAGNVGGVIGLIYISTFVGREGQTLVSGSGRQLAPGVIDRPNGQMGVKNAKEIFYNGVPEAAAI
ncbi:MAG: hypothetical protein Q9222_001415 [Ikaeria aurantiellina]